MKEVTDAQRKKIQRYLALDEDELYSLIPPYLSEYERTLFAPLGMIGAGKAFFEKVYNDLKKAVCEEFDWPSKRSNPEFDDTVTLVAAISDVLAGCIGAVPPFIIATLLVKKGLDALCGSSKK